MQINPFEVIIDRINCLESKLDQLKCPPNAPALEIIDRAELCKRLAITVPTTIRWEKKGKIPSIRIGSSVRYNWPAVIVALEQKSNNKSRKN